VPAPAAATNGGVTGNARRIHLRHAGLHGWHDEGGSNTQFVIATDTSIK